MATVTTNNLWDIPQSTDFVKDGATAIANLGQDIDTSVGTGLLAWTSFVPTFYVGSWGVGNGIWNTTYAKIGKIVHWRGSFICGTTTTFGSSLTLSAPPIAPKFYTLNESNADGKASYRNATNVISGGVAFNSGLAIFYVYGAAGSYVNNSNINTTVPFTWAATSANTFAFNITYEAA
jgi:hypothetical protein